MSQLEHNESVDKDEQKGREDYSILELVVQLAHLIDEWQALLTVGAQYNQEFVKAVFVRKMKFLTQNIELTVNILATRAECMLLVGFTYKHTPNGQSFFAARLTGHLKMGQIRLSGKELDLYKYASVYLRFARIVQAYIGSIETETKVFGSSITRRRFDIHQQSSQLC